MTEYEKFWDEMSKTEEVDYDDEMINRLLRLKAIQSHLSGVHKILDVGAATGAYSIPLARMGFDVVHLDLSDEMIKAAKDKAIGYKKINRHLPYLSITLHKCYPYYLFGISTFPSSAYHSIALRKFSITIV